MITCKDVSDNLSGFYLRLSETPGFTNGEIEGLPWVMAIPDIWPAFILGGGEMTDSSLDRINESIVNNKIPAFWIKEELPQSDFANKAGKYNIKMINYWKGMGLETSAKDSDIAIKSLSGVSIDIVRSKGDLNQWVKIIETEIITGKELFPGVFHSAMSKEDIDFWQLKVEEETVSTLLAFKYNDITGFYMIATVKSHRGKGYAHSITAGAINYYMRKGLTKFVLHSTIAGYPLYKKLGFRDICKYGIYWKIGKF